MLGFWPTPVGAQTKEQLRQIYNARDYARMEAIANTGHTEAEAWMGLIRQQQRRRPEAKEWWRRAALKGDAWAIYNLAEMHLRDGELEPAMHWFRVGSNSGVPSLQVKYGKLLIKGVYVEKNVAGGARVIEEAARKGYESAYLELADLYARGVGVPQDRVEAVALALVSEVVLETSQAERATRFRETIEPGLSPEQKSVAFERAASWHPEFRERSERRQRLEAEMTVTFWALMTLLALVSWFIVHRVRQILRPTP